ncbi:hypothetical protein CGX12_02050 [Zobellella denitrificans]|uniref:Uncharacterized protein n=1 Tax=Zobellella denitrificans TaxID=347534 RepID=A0A231N2V7_9GAMM|nr:hypothetical protein [Zobellella denitrificans]ATG74006.1 hypothetical protein AN401_09200 [Zobellella denitrificans]OXS16864.1 hypothetical protein CGX12_02050 [Zobellella denitrificans]
MRDRLTGPKLVQILVVLGILSGAFWLRTCADGQDTTVLEKENVDFCDIAHEACQQHLDGLEIEARLLAEPLAAEQPFRLEVRFSDPQVRVTRSVLEGESMYMGTLPALLEQGEPGHWQGQALVGACTEARMVWAWVLDIEQGNEPRRLKFLFELRR